MMTNILKHKNQILVFSTYIQICFLLLQTVLYRMVGASGIIHALILVMCAIPMIVCIYIWVTVNIAPCILCYSLAIIFLILQYVFFSENRAYLQNYIFYFLLMCLPSFLNLVYVDDERIHNKVLTNISYFMFALGTIYSILGVIKGTSFSDYNMAFSYYMLLPACVFLFNFWDKYSILQFVLSVVTFIEIFFMGSRGAAVIWVIFFVISIFVAKGRILCKAIMVALIAAILAVGGIILTYLSGTIQNFGFISRNLLLLTNGSLLQNTDRSNIAIEAWKHIMNHPIIGNGIGADYRLIGMYTHNLFTDWFLHFGLIVGVLLIAGLLLLVIVTFNNEKNKLLFAMMFCYGFLPIILSGTYLSDIKFWIFMGYCFSRLHYKLVIDTGHISIKN